MPEPWTVSLRFLESLPTEDGRELPECILSCSVGCSSSRRVGRERDVKDRSELPPPGAPQFVPESPKESRTSSPRSPHTGPRVPKRPFLPRAHRSNSKRPPLVTEPNFTDEELLDMRAHPLSYPSRSCSRDGE